MKVSHGQALISGGVAQLDLRVRHGQPALLAFHHHITPHKVASISLRPCLVLPGMQNPESIIKIPLKTQNAK